MADSLSTSSTAQQTDHLVRLYHELVRHGHMVSVASFKEAAEKTLGLKLTRNEAKIFLTAQPSYGENAAAPGGLHVATGRFNPYRATELGHFQVDLMDVHSSTYAPTLNRQVRWLMIAVDLLSSTLVVVPMSRKTKESCLKALETIVLGSEIPVREVAIDGESGVRSALVQELLQRRKIALSRPRSCYKAENRIRLIRRAIVRFQRLEGTKKYLDFLKRFVSNYNQTHVVAKSSSLKLTPVDIVRRPWLLSEVDSQPSVRFHPDKVPPNPSIRILCRVRVWNAALSKATTSLGTKESRSTGGWSRKIFTITKISHLTQLYPMYEVCDLDTDGSLRIVAHALYSHQFRKTCCS